MVPKIGFSVIIIVVVTFGCAVPQKKAEIVHIDKPGTSAITYPTELRGTYFIIGNDAVRYCAEPAPDVALDTIQKLAAELSAKLPTGEGGSGKVDTELSNKVVQLAGRTELILLAREMLYRSCELTLNNPESSQEALKMYNRVADLVEHLGQADKALAEAELLRVSYGPDKSSGCIRDWVYKDSDNAASLKSWLQESAGGISPAMFIHGADYSAKRTEFLKAKQIECN